MVVTAEPNRAGRPAALGCNQPFYEHEAPTRPEPCQASTTLSSHVVHNYVVLLDLITSHVVEHRKVSCNYHHHHHPDNTDEPNENYCAQYLMRLGHSETQ